MHLLASLQPQATNSAEHGSLSPATGGAHAGTGKPDAGDAGQRNTPGKCCLAVSYCLQWSTKPAPKAGLGSQNLSLFAGKLEAALLGALSDDAFPFSGYSSGDPTPPWGDLHLHAHFCFVHHHLWSNESQLLHLNCRSLGIAGCHLYQPKRSIKLEHQIRWYFWHWCVCCCLLWQ